MNRVGTPGPPPRRPFSRRYDGVRSARRASFVMDATAVGPGSGFARRCSARPTSHDECCYRCFHPHRSERDHCCGDPPTAVLLAGHGSMRRTLHPSDQKARLPTCRSVGSLAFHFPAAQKTTGASNSAHSSETTAARSDLWGICRDQIAIAELHHWRSFEFTASRSHLPVNRRRHGCRCRKASMRGDRSVPDLGSCLIVCGTTIRSRSTKRPGSRPHSGTSRCSSAAGWNAHPSHSWLLSACAIANASTRPATARGQR